MTDSFKPKTIAELQESQNKEYENDLNTLIEKENKN